MDLSKIIEAEERHIFKLWTLCRVCGQAGEKLQYCLDNYNNLLEALYSTDLSKDDPAVHPQMVCQNCRLVLQHYLKRGSKAKTSKGQERIPRLPDMYTFKKHSDECDVCGRASGLLPKRKRPGEQVETFTPAKLTRSSNEQPVGDLSIADTAETDRENSEVMGSSQESDRANVLLQAIQGAIGEEAIMENPEGAVDRPDEEGFTKYVYLNMIRRFKARGVKEDKSSDSINVERFRQKNFASTFLACSLCKRLPLKPVTTECKHVFCESCISDWLNFGNVCPKCEEVIVELSDATEQLNHLYMLLDAPCSFADKGCDAKLTPLEILNHEKDCPYNDKTVNPSNSSDEEEHYHEQAPELVKKIRVAQRKKKTLRLVTPRQAKSRTEELTDHLNTVCKEDREDKVDILFYMLKQALSSTDDPRASTVNILWRNRKKRDVVKPPKRLASLPPSRPSNRRKGVPRKRGRPRKIPIKVVKNLESSDPEEEEEEEGINKTDTTWKPPSGVGPRRHGRGDSQVMQENDDSEDGNEEDDADENDVPVPSVSGMKAVDQDNSNNVILHTVEDSGQVLEGPSVKC